jgi:hypothetical protein
MGSGRRRAHKGDVRRQRALHYPAILTLVAGLSTSCNDDPGVTVLREQGKFEPEALDFGEVPVDMSRALPVVFRNTGKILFTIEEVTVPQNFTLRGVKGLLEGREVQPGTTFDFEVVFLPTQEGLREGQLIVKGGPTEVVLELRGVGVVRQVPVLAVNPSSVDFGAVALGEEARATVQISNTGTAPGVIERAALRSSGMDIGPADVFLVGTQLPVTVAVGGSAAVDLVFRPTLEAQISDVVVLHAVDHQPLEIGVTGQGVVPLGDVLCTPSRVDFGQVERGTTKTLPVTCEARGGPARLIGASMGGPSTMFLLPTPVSTMDLTPGQTVDIQVEFRPDGTPSVQNGRLTVQYNGGSGPSTVDVNLTGEVIPPPVTETAISVTLEWSTNGTDIDLHLVGPGGVLFEEPLDCHFANDTPDWGVNGDTTDNPFLDRDDVDGYGPEQINLSTAANGNYDVYAHYWTDSNLGNSDTTVQIHINGQLVDTRRRPGFRCSQVWHVGTIRWSNGSGTFTPSDAMTISHVVNCI